MISSPKCFVVSNVFGIDITPASEFGIIKYLFKDLKDTDIFMIDFETKCVESLKENMYDYEKDFIVFAGNITANCRLTSALLSEHESFYTLSWDRIDNKYVELLVGAKSSADLN